MAGGLEPGSELGGGCNLRPECRPWSDGSIAAWVVPSRARMANEGMSYPLRAGKDAGAALEMLDVPTIALGSMAAGPVTTGRPLRFLVQARGPAAPPLFSRPGPGVPSRAALSALRCLQLLGAPSSPKP